MRRRNNMKTPEQIIGELKAPKDLMKKIKFDFGVITITDLQGQRHVVDGYVGECLFAIATDLRTQLADAQAQLAAANTHLSAWYEKFENADDRGPIGEGWQSDEFCTLIEATKLHLTTRQPTQDKGGE
jgi:hypothetical protein